MGQSIGWYRFTEDKKAHKWADDIPNTFDDRFQGRWEWFGAIWEAKPEHVQTCSCPKEGSHSYGCSDVGMIRPTDFVAFRAKLNELGLLVDDEEHEIFREMTDWLEVHPDVYVDYN